MSNTAEEIEVGKLNCTNCGAELNFKPGTTQLNCEYCQTANDIPIPDEDIEELDFETYVSGMLDVATQVKETFIKCDTCGASSHFEDHISAASCSYCGASLVIESVTEESVIRPKSLLPFKLTQREAIEAFKKWVKSLWFTPNDLKKASLNLTQLKGVYLPYWTFDTRTESVYVGQRGKYYYVTETYISDGKTKTHRVQKTRWTNVTGHVQVNFDDILVVATNSLLRKHLDKLEPWDLPELVPYEKSFLSGFVSEKYQVDLSEGFNRAKQIVDSDIRMAIKRDIGGDDQRIISVNSSYEDITFKHILLPVYVSAFKYKEKLYQIFVNARTGEVQGQRPWSWIKIGLAIGMVLVVIGILWYFGANK